MKFKAALSGIITIAAASCLAAAAHASAWDNVKNNPHIVFADYFDDGTSAPAKGSVSEKGTMAYADGPDGTKALRLNAGANYLQIFDDKGGSPFKGRAQAAIAFKAAADDINKTSWYVYSAVNSNSPKRDPRNYIAALNIGKTMTFERYANAGYMAEMARAQAQTGFLDVVVLINDSRTEIYVDGKFAGEKQESGSLSDILGADPVTYIGYGAWWGEYTNGVTLDDVEIYDAAPMIDLGDTLHLEGDLVLPSFDDEGIAVTWSSSDESVITADGRVTRPKTGKTSAALTAKVKMGNIEIERDFPVAVYGTEAPYDVRLRVGSDKGVDIQKNMYGLFFEDISYAADGGLSAEKIENRSFEQLWQKDKNNGRTSNATKNPLYAWTAAGSVTFPESGSVSEKNPTFARLTGTKLSNAAYDGIYAKKGDRLNISFYARSDGFSGSIRAGADGQMIEVVGAGELTNSWKKYTAQLTVTEDIRKKPFEVVLSQSGTVDIDFISCVPDDAVCGVFRRDLAEKLKALEPGFLRFPGGCIIEGFDLANRYQWKKSVGPAEDRQQNWTRWGGAEYNQSLAIGYFEYLELCEYLDCAPVPVLNVGLSCEYNKPKETVPVYASQVKGDEGVEVDGYTYSTAFYEYIQDALDLIEFCSGTDESNEWTALRKAMGHETPFDLTMLGIGNEQWQIEGNQWHERYEAFERVIHKYYPEMKLISTSGPSSDDRAPDWDFSNSWKWIREKKDANDMFTYATDEHYYNSADWFFEHTDRYDSYARNAKVFAGEYAANGTYGNTIYSALAEAAAMTGFERNADVVYMASYAPLFCREGYSNWSPDMIWFDGESSYGKPDYYEQQMYMKNNGSYTLPSEAEKSEGDTFFESVSYDEETGDVIVKAVNPAESTMILDIDLTAVKEKYGLAGTTQETRLSGSSRTDTNTLSEPEKVVPVTGEITNTTDTSLNYRMPALTFAVLRIHTANTGGRVYTAAYNAEGRLINCVSGRRDASEFDGAAYIKVFCWDSKMKPTAETVEIK